MSPIDVATGSRLHFGLICGAADSRWHYGGIGLMVDSPGWRIRAEFCDGSEDKFDTSSPVRGRLQSLISQFRTIHADIAPVRFSTSCESGFHSGLGSGTQLTLAASAALLILSGQPRPASIDAVASSFGRSRRSAIGTFGFDYGGFVVDRGRGPQETTSTAAAPQVIPPTRMAFPEEWRMVIVTPLQSEGMSGAAEEQFFGERPYLAPQMIDDLQQLIEGAVIPGIRQHQFRRFRSALVEYSEIVGGYYASAQGGVFSSQTIRDLIHLLSAEADVGAVQSSWGPSVCIPAASSAEASALAQRIGKTRFADQLTVLVAKGLNTGATIRSLAPESPGFQG